MRLNEASVRLVGWFVVGLGVLATVAYAQYDFETGVLGIDGSSAADFFDHGVFSAAFFLAGLACGLRAYRARRDRGAWLAFAAGLVLWGVAEVYWAAEILPLGDDAPYPSLADGIWALAYAAFLIGAVRYLWTRTLERSVGLWFDAVIGLLATAAVGVALLAPAVGYATEGDTMTVVTNLMYPVADVVLIALALGVTGIISFRRIGHWGLIAAAFVTLALADGLYAHQVNAGTYGTEGVFQIDWMWPLSATMLAVAATSRLADRPAERGRYRGLIFPIGFAAIAIALLAYDQVTAVSPIAVILALAALAAVVLRLAISFGENRRLLATVTRDATTDALTGLGNRRQLIVDLEHAFDDAGTGPGGQRTFAIFDLDGFKTYNDSFGHGAGDLLLARMGSKLAAAVADHGVAYRLGGDEFCILGRPGIAADLLIPAGVDALSEHGERFAIGSSYGAASIPLEAGDPSSALQLVDGRMYARKRGQRSSAAQQAHDVLVRAIREREPNLYRHQNGVARRARTLAVELGIGGEDLEVIVRAAELHDVGKVAIPDAILNKPGPLDEGELALIRSHTMIGQRIIAAAPAMASIADLVRATHERFDGDGYPDGLRGEKIPLGARVIFVCDAYEAMTTERPYRRAIGHQAAIAELRANAGTQFDAGVVEEFCALLERQPEAAAGAGTPVDADARPRAGALRPRHERPRAPARGSETGP